eukprot:5243823-Amphidinium_carterae.1
MVGFFPDLRTEMVASSSSSKTIRTFFPISSLRIVVAGRPTIRSAVSAATISASGVEWLTQDCRLEIAVIGRCVLVPFEVDLPEKGQPAKSASAY